jgi:flagellar motor switch protein FliN/FliY
VSGDEIRFEALSPPPPAGAENGGDLGRLEEVPVELAVEIGRTSMTIGETLKLGRGSIVSVNRLAGEPVDLLVNGKRIARGEVVVVDEEFGLRITDVVSVARRLSQAQAFGDAGGQAPADAPEASQGATGSPAAAAHEPAPGPGEAPPYGSPTAPTEPASVEQLDDAIVWEDPGQDASG